MNIKKTRLYIICAMLSLFTSLAFSQHKITFSTPGQKFGVVDLDHFWLSNTPNDSGIYFERKCENPSSASVGQKIARSNALNFSVWGQFGVEGFPPWNPKSGSVTYDNVAGSGGGRVEM